MNGTSKRSEIKEWTMNSWKSLKISQQPVYKDTQLLESIKNKVRVLFYNFYRLLLFLQLSTTKKL